MRACFPAALLAAASLAACSEKSVPGATRRVVAPRYVVHDTSAGADTANVYLATRAGAFAAAAAGAKPMVYVPNSRSNSVSEIDPVSMRVVRTFHTGKLPQHVVPSYDLQHLYVANNNGNSLVPIDPATGDAGPLIRVDDPYNMYFTPDGSMAMIIAEARHRFDFRDAKTFKLIQSVHVDCAGLDHLDFTADDKYAVATCEFSGQLVKIDLATRAPIGYLKLQGAAMPQDIRSSPDGKLFYVADMKADGVHVVDPNAFKQVGFIHTGKGTHGIVVAHGGSPFYISNRGWNTILGGHHGPGSITVLDPRTQKILATWPVPGGGSPDMGNVSADGKQLWLSGRYDSEVYVFDTSTGKLIKRIPVGTEPHGLCVWPEPGRFSLGHTGNMR
jgi:YVTN family beta-propeller protein